MIMLYNMLVYGLMQWCNDDTLNLLWQIMYNASCLLTIVNEGICTKAE